MTPFTIALSPAHTPTAPGAQRGHINEYGLSSAIIGDAIFRLSKLGHIAHLIGSDSNRDQVAAINEIGPDFGLELHFNSYSTQALHGTEVLHSGSVRGSELAQKLQTRLVAALGTKDRGIKKAYYQQDPRKPIIEIVRGTVCPFVVVEPLFLSCDDDFSLIDIPLISIAIVNGCLDYAEATG